MELSDEQKRRIELNRAEALAKVAAREYGVDLGAILRLGMRVSSNSTTMIGSVVRIVRLENKEIVAICEMLTEQGGTVERTGSVIQGNDFFVISEQVFQEKRNELLISARQRNSNGGGGNFHSSNYVGNNNFIPRMNPPPATAAAATPKSNHFLQGGKNINNQHSLHFRPSLMENGNNNNKNFPSFEEEQKLKKIQSQNEIVSPYWGQQQQQQQHAVSSSSSSSASSSSQQHSQNKSSQSSSFAPPPPKKLGSFGVAAAAAGMQNRPNSNVSHHQNNLHHKQSPQFVVVMETADSVSSNNNNIRGKDNFSSSFQSPPPQHHPPRQQQLQFSKLHPNSEEGAGEITPATVQKPPQQSSFVGEEQNQRKAAVTTSNDSDMDAGFDDAFTLEGFGIPLPDENLQPAPPPVAPSANLPLQQQEEQKTQTPEDYEWEDDFFNFDIDHLERQHQQQQQQQQQQKQKSVEQQEESAFPRRCLDSDFATSSSGAKSKVVQHNNRNNHDHVDDDDEFDRLCMMLPEPQVVKDTATPSNAGIDGRNNNVSKNNNSFSNSNSVHDSINNNGNFNSVNNNGNFDSNSISINNTNNNNMAKNNINNNNFVNSTINNNININFNSQRNNNMNTVNNNNMNSVNNNNNNNDNNNNNNTPVRSPFFLPPSPTTTTTTPAGGGILRNRSPVQKQTKPSTDYSVAMTPPPSSFSTFSARTQSPASATKQMTLSASLSNGSGSNIPPLPSRKRSQISFDSNNSVTPKTSASSSKKAASSSEERVYWWLQEGRLRDAQGRLANDPDYDPTTVYIPPDMKFTELAKQYWAIKADNFDVLLFCKVGKFYELYELDADVGHRELGLRFTSQGGEGNRMRCVGVPESKFQENASKLVARGYKVGCIEEMQRKQQQQQQQASLSSSLTPTPPMSVSLTSGSTGTSTTSSKQRNAIIRRELRRIYTPGTLVDMDMIGDDAARQLLVLLPIHTSRADTTMANCDYYFQKPAAAAAGGRTMVSWALCAVDPASGRFGIGRLPPDETFSALHTVLLQIRPNEVAVPVGTLDHATKRLIRAACPSVMITSLRCACSASCDSGYSGNKSFPAMSVDQTRQYLIDSLQQQQSQAKKVLHQIGELNDPQTQQQHHAGACAAAAEDPTSLLPRTLKQVWDDDFVLEVIGLCLSYLKQLKIDEDIVGMGLFYPIQEAISPYLMLDATMLASMEILESLERPSINNNLCNNNSSTSASTLLGYLDRCVTPFGRRRLRWWVTHPLRAKEDIEERQAALQDLLSHPEASLAAEKLLKQSGDAERAIARVHTLAQRVKQMRLMSVSMTATTNSASTQYSVPSGHGDSISHPSLSLTDSSAAMAACALGGGAMLNDRDELDRRVLKDLYAATKGISGIVQAADVLATFREDMNSSLLVQTCTLADTMGVGHLSIGDSDGMSSSSSTTRNGNRRAIIHNMLLPFQEAFQFSLDSMDECGRGGGGDTRFNCEKSAMVQTATKAVADAKQALQDYLSRVRQELSLPIRFATSGRDPYLLEVPQHCSGQALPPNFKSVGENKSVARYMTDECSSLVCALSNAEEDLRTARRIVIAQLCELFDDSLILWNQTITCGAQMDILLSLAKVSSPTNNSGQSMVWPRIVVNNNQGRSARGLSSPCSSVLQLVNMSHPFLLQSRSTFIPISVCIGGGLEDVTESSEGISPQLLQPMVRPSQRIFSAPSTAIITGPNMGGKSTCLRVACIAVILAQLGCAVPAEHCVLSPADRIFARLGARDDIMQGRSTFLIEMQETAAMLRDATSSSLLVLDELGRGTSTHDGYAIAHAVVRYISQVLNCRTLFATHYHSLSRDFEHDQRRVGFFHMACDVDTVNQTIVFLYKLVNGTCPSSYGTLCARSAGLPRSIVDRAAILSREFEEKLRAKEEEAAAAAAGSKRKTPDSPTPLQLAQQQEAEEDENMAEILNEAEINAAKELLKMNLSSDSISMSVAAKQMQTMLQLWISLDSISEHGSQKRVLF